MKNPTLFMHKGVRYQIAPMDAIEQCILAQKLTPLLGPVMKIVFEGSAAARAIAIMSTDSSPERDEAMNALLSDVGAFATVLQKMPTDVARSIYASCLKQLSRQGGESMPWQVVWNESSGRMMYDDIEGWDVLILASKVIQDQLGNFMQGALSMPSFAPQT
jgi:hypothetical protein